MFAKHLKNLVLRESDDASKALWKIVNPFESQMCVVDDNDCFTGTLGRSDFPTFCRDYEKVKVGDIFKRGSKFLEDNKYVFEIARSIFLENKNIYMLPVVDEQRNISDVIFRFQAFYHNYFKHDTNHLIRMHNDGYPADIIRYNYAYCLWLACIEAAALGYERISAIEFGVAGGGGLCALQWHARAMTRIFGIEIDIYGFDSGQGLPAGTDYRDLQYYWSTPGAHHMGGIEALQERLFNNVKLILGDIRETAPAFCAEHKPAPIGVMLVDVDLYSSTVPVLNMFREDDRFFLPRVMMYFDDIPWNGSCVGEALAISEFNCDHEQMKISPEGFYPSFYCGNAGTSPVNLSSSGLWINNIKTCHRFHHADYNRSNQV